jgi:pimeloyl-ACP methyl ester carboxylesterase
MRRIAAAVAVLLLGGCAAAPPASEPAATRPDATKTATASSEVGFTAADGVQLKGRVFGSGRTAVILSNMGDNDPAPWEGFAPELAAKGYLVMTYSFRYPLRTNSFTAAMAASTVPDLQGAIAFVRSRGATAVVLVGASLGADTTAKVAGSAGAAAVVIIAGELEVTGYDFAVTPKELASMTAPKLFVASKDDTNTSYADSQKLFARVPKPKEFVTYDSSVHGVGLFTTSDGGDLRHRIVEFVLQHAPA